MDDSPFPVATTPSPGLNVVDWENRVDPERLRRYRLDRVQDLYDLGLEEAGDRGVTVVEWGDLVEQAVPAEHLVIRIEPGAADTERVLEVTFHGPRWCARQDALEHALRDRADH